MPKRKTNSVSQDSASAASSSAASSASSSSSNNNNNNNRVVLNEGLLATDVEKEATSASLYSDHKARISSNLGSVRDRVRNSAFSNAFGASTQGKKVLHVGCGIGLLPMMAARAGAAQVIAVDSSSIVHTATELAKHNKLSGTVQFFQGKLSEGKLLEQLPIKKFDVIVCEWMGSFVTNDEHFVELEYCLANNMLDEDHGVICPNRAQLHVVALSDYNYRSDMLDYWDSVYGFQMHAMKPLVLHEASTGHIPKDCIVSQPGVVHALDLSTPAAISKALAGGGKGFAPEVKKYSSDFKITVERKCTVHFLTFYLSAAFFDKEQPRGNFILGFSLGDRGSAFTEVSLMLPQPIPVFAGDELVGSFNVNPVKHQFTEIELTVSCKNSSLPENFSLKEKYVFQY